MLPLEEFLAATPVALMAKVAQEARDTLSAPASIATRIGKLEFKDGAPTAETVYEKWIYQRTRHL